MSTPPPTAPREVVATVGIVVPAYRTAAYVGETLRSVQAQTFAGWECVVVDDGSPDEVAEIVAGIAEEDPRVRLVRQANQGLSAARNVGLAHLSPEVQYVAFLDSDDTWCDEALEVLVAALEADPAAVGAYGYAELVDDESRPFEPGLHPGRQQQRHEMTGWIKVPVAESRPVEFSEVVIDSPIWPPAVAIHRRSVIDLAGAFDPALPQLEDVDFITRMVRFGHYVNARTQVAWYRQHPGQMTKRRAEFWWSHDALRRKTWESADNTSHQRVVVERAWKVAQWRRLARCSLRLTTSVAHRDWPRARELFRGWRILGSQLLQGTPPSPNLDHVVWAGRDV